MKKLLWGSILGVLAIASIEAANEGGQSSRLYEVPDLEPERIEVEPVLPTRKRAIAAPVDSMRLTTEDLLRRGEIYRKLLKQQQEKDSKIQGALENKDRGKHNVIQGKDGQFIIECSPCPRCDQYILIPEQVEVIPATFSAERVEIVP